MLREPAAPPGSPQDLIGIVRDIVAWIRTLRKGPDARLPYTLASLPTASEWNGTTLPVSDGVGGKPTVTSINALWTYPDGTTV